MFKETEIGRVRRNIIKLLRQSALDGKFRALCLENGAKAYLELSGEPLPEKCTVQFVERESADSGGGPQPDKPQACLLPEFLPPTWLE